MATSGSHDRHTDYCSCLGPIDEYVADSVLHCKFSSDDDDSENLHSRWQGCQPSPPVLPPQSSCPASCQGVTFPASENRTCDDLQALQTHFTCAYLESMHGCDCSGCVCAEDSGSNSGSGAGTGEGSGSGTSGDRGSDAGHRRGDTDFGFDQDSGSFPDGEADLGFDQDSGSFPDVEVPTSRFPPSFRHSDPSPPPPGRRSSCPSTCLASLGYTCEGNAGCSCDDLRVYGLTCSELVGLGCDCTHCQCRTVAPPVSTTGPVIFAVASSFIPCGTNLDDCSHCNNGKPAWAGFGVYRSEDMGASWTEIFTNLELTSWDGNHQPMDLPNYDYTTDSCGQSQHRRRRGVLPNGKHYDTGTRVAIKGSSTEHLVLLFDDMLWANLGTTRCTVCEI